MGRVPLTVVREMCVTVSGTHYNHSDTIAPVYVTKSERDNGPARYELGGLSACDRPARSIAGD